MRDALLLGGLLAAAVAGLLAAGPVPQPPCYHEFADQREMLGVPHFANVVTNLPFAAIGIWALLRLRRVRPALDPAVARFYAAGVALVGPGSAWYHLRPDNGSLAWDRLPIALVSATVLLLALEDFRIASRPRRWLAPALAAAAGSVAYWAYTDAGDGGDLRPYIFVTAAPALALVLLLIRRPGESRMRGSWILILAFYGLARLAEVADSRLGQLPLLLSGHPLKHLLAAAACGVLARALLENRPAPGDPVPERA